jgi:hypothetical protein
MMKKGQDYYVVTTLKCVNQEYQALGKCDTQLIN